MADFLLELFSEEIPARMQGDAAAQLERLFAAKMQDARLSFSGLKTYVTPRRIALLAKAIPDAQPDVTIEKKGPKTDAPEAALNGFLKSTGLTLAQLEKRQLGKDEVYFAITEQKGQPTTAALKEIIEKILAEFSWPKSMRWGAYPQSWVRPLHSILCLFGEQVIPVRFGPIEAGNTTRGHRFLSPSVITVKEPGEYEALLEKAHVIADASKRKANILAQMEKAAAAQNLKLKADERLLEEVTGLVEWPVVLTGTIDPQFMDLPKEVLVSEMRNHQKYFALENAKGEISRQFLITANMETSDGGKAIIAGNERVLRARLSDGRFFWDQDRKKKLDEWAAGLKDVIFHAKLGTVADKVSRVVALAERIAPYVFANARSADRASPERAERRPMENSAEFSGDIKKVTRAAQLCKADLVTGMVGEFAELQGIMGRYYALAQGEAPEVAEAIKEHYSPLGPNDNCPKAPVSVCVALADKLDTLVGMFAIGEKPTGSKDPFALRRSALGIIRLILENGIRLPLRTFILEHLAICSFCKQMPLNDLKKHCEDILAFFSDRLFVMLKDQGIRQDCIKAVLDGKDDDLMRIVARIKALETFLAQPHSANLLAAYKRAANILAIEEKKDGRSYAEVPDTALFATSEEKNLSAALNDTSAAVAKALGAEDFAGAMTALASLRTPMDIFFDKILVNAEDKAQRANRLKLLTQIRTTMDQVANFALVEGTAALAEAA